jgi:hypothetical protein
MGDGEDHQFPTLNGIQQSVGKTNEMLRVDAFSHKRSEPWMTLDHSDGRTGLCEKSQAKSR